MKNDFYALLKSHFEENLEGVSPLQKAIREKAWHRFEDLGLPDKHKVGYQYFPFSQFYQESYERAEGAPIPQDQITNLIHPDCKRTHLIFINGQYSPELSDTTGLPKEVVVLRLRDALTNFGNFLQVRLSRTLKEETDPFATLNIALIQMGLFIYIPPNITVDAPLQCLHLISNDRPVMFHPRIHFFLGKRAKVQWIYDHHCLKDFEYFANGVVDIALEEGAHFEQYGIVNPCRHGWCMEATRVTQKRDSTFKSLTYTKGTKSVRQDFRISLMEENATCDLKGISLLSEGRQAHTNIHIDHQAPHCRSHQLFKTVLSDHSRSSFEGKIYVHSKAQKTEAYQLNNNLLLDDKSVANSKPNLEIFADDVKASHGATVSQLNQEHIHYLRTRGIEPQTAKMLLLEGFGLDILEDVSYVPVKVRMQQLAKKYVTS